MTVRQRVISVLNGEKPDRLPVFEWATWWDKTIAEWQREDTSCPGGKQSLFRYFGLDSHHQFWVVPHDGRLPAPAYHGAPVLKDVRSYRENLRHLFPEERIERLKRSLSKIEKIHTAGRTTVWFSLEGFFWFPRTLFGIENHLYAFYDQADLMLEMNESLTAYHRKTLDAIYGILSPEFMTFAEDMSYNHGPMLSKDMYDSFMLPFYRQIVPEIKKRGTKVLIDTDGNVEPLIPWFAEAGIEGVLPLERQAGVDVNRIREDFPEWIMIGGFDKTVMHRGEEAMRQEFQRILPAIRSGRYIPAVDHQTPPDVTIENYRTYCTLLREFTGKM